MPLRTLDLDGPVHYMDFGGTGPTMVLVHGLGGSHHNWLWVGEKLARGMLRLCCRDLTRFPEGVVDLHVQAACERHERMPWSHAAFIQAARSLVFLLQRKRHFRALEKGIRVPTLLVQGSEDRLVPVANSRELARERPDWTYVEYAGVGHTPMMECPDAFVSTVETWLDGPAQVAAGVGERVRVGA